ARRRAGDARTPLLYVSAGRGVSSDQPTAWRAASRHTRREILHVQRAFYTGRPRRGSEGDGLPSHAVHAGDVAACAVGAGASVEWPSRVRSRGSGNKGERPVPVGGK